MKKIALAITLMFIIVALGCGPQQHAEPAAEQEVNEPAPAEEEVAEEEVEEAEEQEEESVEQPAEEPLPEEELAEEEPDHEEADSLEFAEGMECTSELEGHHVKQALFASPTNPVVLTEDGFTFRVLPAAEDGETVPTTANVNVQVYPTALNDDAQGREVEGSALFSKSYYMKVDNVLPDCGPKPIEISFSDTKWNKDRVKALAEDDPGLMLVTIKIGNEEHEARYKPWEMGDIPVVPAKP